MHNPAPPRFHLLAKPTGAICDLASSYCFFLDKELRYPGSLFPMSDEVLENYIRQLIEGHRTPQVTVAWQGVTIPVSAAAASKPSSATAVRARPRRPNHADYLSTRLNHVRAWWRF